MALVITSWRVARNPEPDGTLVHIEGRQEGILSWILTTIGIDTKTRLRINSSNIYFEHGSLAGFNQRLIPVTNLSSAYFGFTKPWREALVIGAVLLPLFGLGLIVGPLYYFLNKKLSLGVVEVGGLISGIEFKRSVIEGKNITEEESKVVMAIIRDLMETVHAPALRPALPATGT